MSVFQPRDFLIQIRRRGENEGKTESTWWADFSLHEAMQNLNLGSKSSPDTSAVIHNYVRFDRCGANHLQCRRRNTQHALQESGAAKPEQGVDAV